MAIEPCRECGNEVSTQAESCPNCGAPNPTASTPPARNTGSGTARKTTTEGSASAGSAGDVAKGVFGGILGCVVAPLIVSFLLFLLMLAAA